MKTFLLIPFLLLAWPFVTEAFSSPVVDEARAALQKGDIAAAEALLVPLTTGEQADATACHQLALVRQRQDRPADAVALLERATVLDPAKPEYFSALGVALSARMREVPFTQQAALAGKMKKAFAKSIEIEPNHLSGLIGLARFYTNAPEIAGGSIEKAQEFAARVQKVNPFLGELEFANIAEHTEDFSAALAHFDAASKLQPDNAGPHLGAGRMLAQLARKEEARARFARALELDPKSAAVKKALASLDSATP